MKGFSHIAFTALIVLSIVPFSSCKKGPDDPAISLRSRTARLTGVWKLSNDEITTTTSRDGTVKETIVSSFDGTFRTDVTTTNNGSSNPEVKRDKYTYATIWTINNDHTLKLEYNWDGESYVREGTWVWLEGNNKDLKNKEAVKFLITKEIYKGSISTIKGNEGGPIIILSRLANDELQVDVSQTFSSEGYSRTSTGTQTFRQ